MEDSFFLIHAAEFVLANKLMKTRVHLSPMIVNFVTFRKEWWVQSGLASKPNIVPLQLFTVAVKWQSDELFDDDEVSLSYAFVTWDIKSSCTQPRLSWVSPYEYLGDN